jgi:hypothetical protein
MVLGRVGLALVALGAAGCTLAARDHACWPLLAHQYHGHVPDEVVRALAREHGTRKQVGPYHAPAGYYWRKRRPSTLDVHDIRTLMGDYEMARCPNALVKAEDSGVPALPPAP